MRELYQFCGKLIEDSLGLSKISMAIEDNRSYGVSLEEMVWSQLIAIATNCSYMKNTKEDKKNCKKFTRVLIIQFWGLWYLSYEFELFTTIGYNSLIMLSERLLYYVPLVHDRTESIMPETDKPVVQRIAEKFYKAELEFVTSFPHPYSLIKVYQDGLPIKDQEAINFFIDNLPYSPHNDILRFLKGKGATILGTEDPQLLSIVNDSTQVTRRHLRHKLFEPNMPNPISELAARQHLQKVVALTYLRDLRMPSRIDSTLEIGDIGILFIGLAHQTDKHIDPNIRIVIPEEFAGLT